jgi:hypothetical protein
MACPEPSRGAVRGVHASLLYLALSIAATWPLARGLARDVAWDLGDSILNIWILAWDVEQIRGLLTGDVARLWSFFDAPIFHPAPLALAYSEHLVPQALQVLPVVLLTDNPILGYNLLFLSTFVLSGLGMYLLVRELTGNAPAGLVAGLLFAFAPYRLAQSSHVQVLSSQWMPFVFYGLARYFRSAGPDGRLRVAPLAGAAVALVAQGLSSGYYLLYFTPLAVAFGLWEIGQHRLWRNRRVWTTLAVAGLLATVVVVPFLLPYAALRTQGLGARSRAEVSRFSADVYSYATAFPEQRIWGSVLQAMPKPEGELFPGLVPVFLALIGIVGGSASVVVALSAERTRRVGPRWFVWLLGAAAAGHAVAAVLTAFLRRISVDFGLFVLRISDVDRLLARAAILLGLLLLLSPGARARVAAFMRERGYFVVALVAAAWLSLGPSPQSLGRPLEITALYNPLLEYIPGYDGLRVPARLAMIVAFMIAVLAGYGAASLARTRIGGRALIAFGALFLLEATHVPFVVNGMTPLRDHRTPEARLYRPARAPAVYRAMARESSDAIVVELPLGQPDYDLRAMYYSTVHGRPLVNGYSGVFPPRYGRLQIALADISRRPDVSLDALRSSGATHVILHEAAYLGREGPAIASVLRGAGATELFRDGSDVLLRLPQ